MDRKPNGQGEEYNLKWTNYQNNLVQSVIDHGQSDSLVDVTLFCEGRQIKAHKLVLSACSRYFQELFKGDGFSGIQGSIIHPVIVFNNVKYHHLKHVLDFVYSGQIKVLESDLAEILNLGENLQIKGLSSVKLKPCRYSPGDSPKIKEPSRYAEHNQFIRPVPPATHSTPIVYAKNPLVDSNAATIPSTSYKYNPESKHVETPKDAYSSMDKSKKICRLAVCVTDNREKELSKKSNMEKGRKVGNLALKLENANRRLEIQETLLAKRKDSDSDKGLIKQEKDEPAQKKPKVVLPSYVRTVGTFENSNLKTKQIYLAGPSSKYSESNEKGGEKKLEIIHKPPNPFMIFAKEWRKKLSVEHPDEHGKEISLRLGNLWKSLSPEIKETYYTAATEARKSSEEDLTNKKVESIASSASEDSTSDSQKSELVEVKVENENEETDDTNNYN